MAKSTKLPAGAALYKGAKKMNPVSTKNNLPKQKKLVPPKTKKGM